MEIIQKITTLTRKECKKYNFENKTDFMFENTPNFDYVFQKAAKLDGGSFRDFAKLCRCILIKKNFRINGVVFKVCNDSCLDNDKKLFLKFRNFEHNLAKII